MIFFFFKQRIECMGILMKTMVWQLLYLVKWQYQSLTLIWKWNYLFLKFSMLSHYFKFTVTGLWGFFMFKLHVYVSNQLVFNTGTCVEYVYRLYSHICPLCHTLCLCGMECWRLCMPFFLWNPVQVSCGSLQLYSSVLPFHLVCNYQFFGDYSVLVWFG